MLVSPTRAGSFDFSACDALSASPFTVSENFSRIDFCLAMMPPADRRN
jgi:hypothetical protein